MRKTTKSPGEKIVKDIKRATRKNYSSEEKIRIVLDGLRGEDCQRRRKNLPLGRSKFWPVGAAPWGVMPSNSKHVPRRVGR